MKISAERPLGKKMVRIWADGDACPAADVDTLFKAACRRTILLTLFSTGERNLPGSTYVRTSMLPHSDIASRIKLLALRGDLVVSSNEALLSELQERGIGTLRPDIKVDFSQRLEDLLDRQCMLLRCDDLASADLAKQLRSASKVRQRELATIAAEASVSMSQEKAIRL